METSYIKHRDGDLMQNTKYSRKADAMPNDGDELCSTKLRGIDVVKQRRHAKGWTMAINCKVQGIRNKLQNTKLCDKGEKLDEALRPMKSKTLKR